MTNIIITSNLREIGLVPTGRADIWIWPAPHRAIIVFGKGVTDFPNINEVWDASIGWHFVPGKEEWSEEHHSPYVLPENEGFAHSKITFRKKIEVQEHILVDWKTLQSIIEDAPRSDKKGGRKPGAGRPSSADTRPVLLRLSPDRHTAFRKLGGQQWLYDLLDAYVEEGILNAKSIIDG